VRAEGSGRCGLRAPLRRASGDLCFLFTEYSRGYRRLAIEAVAIAREPNLDYRLFPVKVKFWTLVSRWSVKVIPKSPQ
jgi:hypothetical protein